jgi:Neutral/alkaline non-lysosomal ceramidase.
LKIGYAFVDITPNLGVELSGYGCYPKRKAESILDLLFARAVIFQNDDKKLLLINCDLLILTEPIVNDVKKKIHNELGFHENSIMLLSTHTHTGPSTGGIIGVGEPNNEYLTSLPSLLVEAGKVAFRNLREVKTGKQFVMSPGTIGYNRVDVHKPIDSRLHGGAFYFEEGNPIVLVSCGCHPVTLGRANCISADYPGRVVKALFDKGFDGIFLNGFCGDIDPVSNLSHWGEGTQETIDEYGTLVADAFIDGITKAKYVQDFILDAFEITVKMELQHYDEKDIDNVIALYREEKINNPSFYKIIKIWSENMKSRINDSNVQYFENFAVQVFRIGEIILMGVPAEPFSHIGIIIKESFPHLNIMTLGCANAVLRYIAGKEDIFKSGYTGLNSCFFYQKLPIVAGEGERMAEVIVNATKEKLKSRKGVQ